MKLWVLFGFTLVEVALAVTRYDDFHYPAEEKTEWASTSVPRLVSVQAGSVTVSDGQSTQTADVGHLVFRKWHVIAALPKLSPPAAALEINFARWGAIIFLSGGQAPIVLRKSVGNLDGIRQPHFNFSATEPDYFKKVTSSLEDYPSQLALNLTVDGEYDYESLASTLSPQRDFAEISNANDVTKFVVTYNGRVKCASYNGSNMNGITDFVNLSAPFPNPQTVIFDPASYLKFWPEQFENSKTGLVGGHLRIANIGSFTRSASKGFEMVAFAPMTKPVSSAQEDTLSKPSCHFSQASNDSYIAGCSKGCQRHATLQSAESACASALDCGGVTFTTRYHDGGHYELRAATATSKSPYGEVSWLLANAADCRSLPRLPGINYSPGVYVRLREQSGNEFGSFQYFYASNQTTIQLAAEDEFYSQLFEYQQFYANALSQAMQIHLPDSDRRQADMAVSALLSAEGNYVGDQPNYGNGATYWSYGREDNGSLPLNVLTVEDANLDWGLCDLSLRHLGFYFDNYVKSDGTINYYSWGSSGDSVGDLGRLASMYIKAAMVCSNSAWNERYLAKAIAFGEKMLEIRQAAAHAPTPPTGCKGLLQGAPEHDWSSVKDKYFYNNNVWILRGMEELGAYLLEGGSPRNSTLGKLLLEDAVDFRQDIAASVEQCTVKDSGSAFFFPPYAQVNFKPFDHMTDSRASEYSNFRFYSETLLADVLPRDVEGVMLTWHNNRGGRIGGASRFSGWLDDMPTAGWGYGALTNNRTQDFLALLYGHMATYQSRGSFHSTEQLAFTGEGLYRNFLHWPNPGAEESLTAHASQNAAHPNAGYYAPENDVSFCIVSEVLVARMTRWQLVFEDFYRDSALGSAGASIWLGRGAPRRWFAKGAGFGVTNAPTRLGRISYNVTVTAPGHATYAVQVPETAQGVLWKLRWPGPVSNVQCSQCSGEIAFDDGTVSATSKGNFRVSAAFGKSISEVII